MNRAPVLSIAFALALSGAACQARTFAISAARPRADLTPGATNPAVTQASIGTTICAWGYSGSIRPPESYTEPLKRQLIRSYRYTDRRLGDYELDHLISLELGGAASDPRNLFPEPHEVAGGWGSYAKDRLENRLHELVCSGRLPLAEAQAAIRTDWIAAYRRFIGPVPDNRRLHQYGG